MPALPVGYALLRFIDGFALLAQMDVLPEHGQKGLGTGLIGHITDYLRARNVNALYLTTFTHVPWNAPFYEKCGFAVLYRKEQPSFIKNILEEEKQYGLSHRIAMRLTLVQ
jgi:GNAT superfamily N-acetyltransferase